MTHHSFSPPPSRTTAHTHSLSLSMYKQLSRDADAATKSHPTHAALPHTSKTCRRDTPTRTLRMGTHQGMLEGDVEPAGHENPAAQGPVQEDDAMAAVAP